MVFRAEDERARLLAPRNRAWCPQPRSERLGSEPRDRRGRDLVRAVVVEEIDGTRRIDRPEIAVGDDRIAERHRLAAGYRVHIDALPELERERAEEDQVLHTRMDTGVRDHRAAVGVADEQDRLLDLVQRGAGRDPRRRRAMRPHPRPTAGRRRRSGRPRRRGGAPPFPSTTRRATHRGRGQRSWSQRRSVRERRPCARRRAAEFGRVSGPVRAVPVPGPGCYRRRQAGQLVER